MFILRVFLLLFAIHGLQAYKLVCYLTNWAQYRTGAGKFMPSDVDPSLCTHLIYSFAKLSGNSLTTLEWNDLDLYKQTMDLKKSNANLKVLIAVGGWSAGSAGFSDMVTSDSSRAQFVKQAVDFLTEHGFDGLDLDWEYPGYGSGSRGTDKQQFSKLCQDLRAAFDKKNLLLTAAMAAGQSNIDNAYDIPTISKYIDFFNIMAYDYHGSWETVTGANAPLYATNSLSVSDTIDYYMKLGMPSQKIILGMGAYGRSWTLNSASTNSIGSPANAPGLPGKFTGESGYLAYYEVCQFVDQGWTRRFDQAQKVPYIFNDKQWASYDDEQSLGIKVDYLKSKNLGGAMFWAIDLDDFSGNFCKDGKFPLVNSVKSKLGGSSAPQPETSKKPTSSSSSSTTARKTTTTKRQATTSRKASSSSGNVSCKSSGNDFYPVKGTKCARFYRCTNGVIHYFDCPSGTFFDTKIGSCNNMSAYHCQA